MPGERTKIVYAIIKSGGRQYKAVEGEAILVERLSEEIGTQVELDRVLLISSPSGIEVGKPTVEGAKVLATVVEQTKGPKIRVFKYIPRKRYRLRRGHRQNYTRLKIERIIQD